MAAWGTVVWSATNPLRSDLADRPRHGGARAALADGTLANTVDTDQPRAINDDWPVFAFHFDLGSVRHAPRPVVLSIGHVREPAVSYLGAPLPPLWQLVLVRPGRQMAAFFHADVAAAQKPHGRARPQGRSRTRRRPAARKYAALCALSLRQAYGGTELVSRDGKPWAFLKEISTDGNVSTIDVTYPAMPVVPLRSTPPTSACCSHRCSTTPRHGGWPKEFAEHDLGSSYPNATGHNDGNEEDMPVEESANMLLMTAAYLARDRLRHSARTFATAHYTILKQWADYLVANALDPGFQNQTDDFTGFIAHSANLALKGILALGAMSQMATAAGNVRRRDPLPVHRHATTSRSGCSKAQDTTPATTSSSPTTSPARGA